MKLQAQMRAAEDKLSILRAGGMTPVICYGPDQEPVSLSVQSSDFTKVFRDGGSSTIIDLEVDEEVYEVLVKDIDRHPVSEEVLHVDFYAIKRGEEMQLSVPIVFIGESKAAKDGALLNEILHELEVRCLPRNIPSEITVDVSVLAEPGMSISVSDLNLGEGVNPTAEPTEVVVIVSEVVEEAEETEEDAQAAMNAVLADGSETEGENKKEEE